MGHPHGGGSPYCWWASCSPYWDTSGKAPGKMSSSKSEPQPGVGGIVLLFKPRLMRQVKQQAAQAATTATEAKTGALEERVQRLESIRDVQVDEQDRQQDEAERLISAVSDTPSFDSVYELLTDAEEQGLFFEPVFIRTSSVVGAPLLRVSSSTIELDDRRGEPVPVIGLMFYVLQNRSYREVSQSFVVWGAEHTFRELVQKILRMHVKLNMPTDGLNLEQAFQHLQLSYRRMVDARLSPRGSNSRLRGSLIFLMNDEWALTSTGLEATQSDHFFATSRNVGTGPRFQIAVETDDLCPDDCQNDLWNEAKVYAILLTALRK